MKKIQILIIAAILLVLSTGAFGQGLVLADGEPPLTESTVNRLIDLYEFALDGRFTSVQKKEFTQKLVEQWKSNDTKAISSYVKLLEIYGKLSALDNAKLREAQSQFQNALVGELKKNPGEGYNPLLISVYNKAHTDDKIESQSETLGSVNSTSVDLFSGNTPSQLIGKWQAGSTSSTSYTNSVTGASTNGGGTQVMYTFFPDGRFEYANLYSLTSYSCTTQTMLYTIGHYEVTGSVLKMVTEDGKFTSQDNCNRQYNYEKPAKLETESFNWRVERDEYGTKICLQNSRLNGCAYKRN